MARKFKNVQKRNREAEKQKRIQVIISLLFIGLMVFSVLGIYASNQQNSALNEFAYNGHSFDLVEETPGQFALSTMLGDQELIFYALPQDTFTIPVQGNITAVIGNAQYVALASNPSLEVAPLIDLMRFDFDRYAQVLVAGVPLTTANISGIDCLNATPEIPVITLVESDVTEIAVFDSCIQIESQPTDLYLIRDRLLYSLVGIVDR